jgi:hypothetical protein
MDQEVLNKNLSTDMLITPGREESMYAKVAYTPQVHSLTHSLTHYLYIYLYISDVYIFYMY